MRAIPLLFALVLALGCGESHSADDDGGTSDSGGTDAGASDAGFDAEFDAGLGGRVLELLGGDWTMASGREGYICVRRTLEETVWVREFRPIAPEGTHHTVLTMERRARMPDGVAPCSAVTNGPDMIYGSGVGTEPFTFPEGVAVKIEAGRQLLLNLHLFNTGEGTLEGRSGIEIVTADPTEVEHEAQALLAGRELFAIPPRSSDFEVDGRCTMAADVTIFAVMPHMHELGTFMRVTANAAGGPRVLHEDFYSFEDQSYTMVDTVQLRAGDTIDVNCRYDNPTDSTVTFGDSTRQEMCYAGIYRYPVVGGGLTCTN